MGDEMTDTSSKLSRTSVTLHWLVAVAMIFLLGVGIYMAQTSAYGLYPIHKSIGALVLLIIIPRVVYRVLNGWPPAAASYTKAEQQLSHLIHYILIIGTLVMPISGMLMSAMGGHGVIVFSIELVAMNPDAANPGKVIALNPNIAQAASLIHSVTGYLLAGSVILHIAGALKHHIIDKDGTLKRMLGKSV